MRVTRSLPRRRARLVRAFVPAGACAAVVAFASPVASAAPIKVACVGEQTTHSDQLNRNVEYPVMLEKALGPCADVQNFGDCCATVLQGYPTQPETHPYLSPPAGKYIPSFHESVAFEPDVVVIGSWGKHDTEIANSVYGGALDAAKFQADYDQLVTTYLNLPSKPTVYVSTPLPLPSGQATGVTTSVILPAIESVAAKYHLTIVPLYAAFLNQPQLYKDATHPTDVQGLQTIANTVYATITGGMAPGPDAGCGAGLTAPGASGGDGGTGASGGDPGADSGGAGVADGAVATGGGPAEEDGSTPADSSTGNASGAGPSPGSEHPAGCACEAAVGGRASRGPEEGTLLAVAAAAGLLARRQRRARGVPPGEGLRRPRSTPTARRA
jgi:hypothetical protein